MEKVMPSRLIKGLSLEDTIKVIKAVEADSRIAERQIYEIIKCSGNSLNYKSNT